MRRFTHSYRRARIALGTKHHKEWALAKPLHEKLAVTLEVPAGLDTDQFGTFTGEIARQGSMWDAAQAKAKAAMSLTGLPYGIGTEGSFGPHPGLFFLSCDTEVMVFVDSERGVSVNETLRTERAVFQSLTCKPGDDLQAFIRSARFPSHRLVVSSEGNAASKFVKGIKDRALLHAAIVRAADESPQGLARVTTDMRAHCNPTRMVAIRKLARKLASRLARHCPGCDAAGFGERQVEYGTPCSLCGGPTDVPLALIERCVSCAFVRRTIIGPSGGAPAAQCPYCNP